MQKILYIDETVPHSSLGMGRPRFNIMLNLLPPLYHVTIFTTNMEVESEEDLYFDIHRSVEVVYGSSSLPFSSFLTSSPSFHLLIFTRPYLLYQYLRSLPLPSSPLPKVLYIAESIYALRSILGSSFSPPPPISPFLYSYSKSFWLEKELSIVNSVDHVVAITKKEESLFKSISPSKVSRIPSFLPSSLSPTPFEERSGLFFLGSFTSPQCFNFDALKYFLPSFIELRKHIPSLSLTVVGHFSFPHSLPPLPGLSFEGRQSNLKPYYSKSRILVVPVRFNSGLPSKIIESASYGLPIVTTPLIASLVGWGKEELMISPSLSSFTTNCLNLYNNRSLWYSLRSAAHSKFLSEGSLSYWSKKWLDVVSSVIS